MEACVPQVMIEVQWSYRRGGVGWIKLDRDGSGSETRGRKRRKEMKARVGVESTSHARAKSTNERDLEFFDHIDHCFPRLQKSLFAVVAFQVINFASYLVNLSSVDVLNTSPLSHILRHSNNSNSK